MSGKPAIIYWDTSAFLALLKGEESHGDGVLDALTSQAGAFDRGAIILATSTVGIMEVLSGNLSDNSCEKFEGMVRRSNFQTITASEIVARKAAQLRKHCYIRAKNGGEVTHIVTPADALHIASAMLVEAEVLVTLDSANKGGRRKEMAMTEVSNHYPLPGLKSVPIQRPALGLPGTGLF